MIGIIPSISKTFEVFGDFTSDNLVEGKLYYDKSDGRVYLYSTKETRSNPDTGYYPVWDGKKKYVTQFSNKKYFDKDVTIIDINTMSSKISKSVAEQVLYNQRKSDDNNILNPSITDEDNIFTQCIKGVILKKKITMTDLIDMAFPLQPKMIENYYSALNKITFMRMEKWNIWVNNILHIRYELTIFKDDKKLLSYKYPKNEFNTGVVKYDNITKNDKDDPYKKIVKIIMIMENINKNTLRSKEVDDYTVNNMMTTINGSKPLSAQIFSRFIRMADLSILIEIYDLTGKELLFQYKE